MFDDPVIREADRVLTRMANRIMEQGLTVQEGYDSATPEEDEAMTIMALWMAGQPDE